MNAMRLCFLCCAALSAQAIIDDEVSLMQLHRSGPAAENAADAENPANITVYIAGLTPPPPSPDQAAQGYAAGLPMAGAAMAPPAYGAPPPAYGAPPPAYGAAPPAYGAPPPQPGMAPPPAYGAPPPAYGAPPAAPGAYPPQPMAPGQPMMPGMPMPLAPPPAGMDPAAGNIPAGSNITIIVNGAGAPDPAALDPMADEATTIVPVSVMNAIYGIAPAGPALPAGLSLMPPAAPMMGAPMMGAPAAPMMAASMGSTQMNAPQGAYGLHGPAANLIKMGVMQIATKAALEGVQTGIEQGVNAGVSKEGFTGAAPVAGAAAAPVAAASAPPAASSAPAADASLLEENAEKKTPVTIVVLPNDA